MNTFFVIVHTLPPGAPTFLARHVHDEWTTTNDPAKAERFRTYHEAALVSLVLPLDFLPGLFNLREAHVRKDGSVWVNGIV